DGTSPRWAAEGYAAKSTERVAVNEQAAGDRAFTEKAEPMVAIVENDGLVGGFRLDKQATGTRRVGADSHGVGDQGKVPAIGREGDRCPRNPPKRCCKISPGCKLSRVDCAKDGPLGVDANSAIVG